VALPPTEPPIAADVPLWQIADNAAPAFAVGAALVAVPPTIFVHVVPLNTCNSPAVQQSVHQMISPAAGLAMAIRWACVIRGGNKPLVVLVTSNSAEALGVVVPMPTWAFTPPPQNAENQHVKFFHNKILK
jgi:hypothetical protein